VSADTPEENKANVGVNPVTQEKIREFCYELALALRRITGKVVEDDLDFLGEEKDQPTNTQNEITPEKKSND